MTDPTDGFWRRWLILTFGRSFKGDPDAVPDLAKRIIASELPELARWLVAGAVRLVTRGRYDDPPSSVAALGTWRRDANPVLTFLAERTHPASGAEPGTSASVLYGAYTGWCATNGHRACSATKFGATLRAVGVDKRRSDGAIYAVTLSATLDRPHA